MINRFLRKTMQTVTIRSVESNISNPTMTTELDFKSAQFEQVRGEAELEI